MINKTEHEYYRIWQRLKIRSLRESIEVYPEFYDFWSFVEYINSNLDPRPSINHFITRIDEAQGVVPGNLMWAPKKTRKKNFVAIPPHKSRFTGVVYDKKGVSKPYKAQIVVNYKCRHLGYFADEVDAAKAYDKEARKIGRKTNFLDEE